MIKFVAFQSQLNKTLADVRMHDGGFMEAVPLSQSVVVQQAEKLAAIEDYLAQYGYIPPAPQPVPSNTGKLGLFFIYLLQRDLS